MDKKMRGFDGEMMETVKGLCRAEGFLIGLASMCADRELCGDNRESKIMQEARFFASRISTGADFIIGDERELKELREEVEYLRANGDPVTMANDRAVEQAGR